MYYIFMQEDFKEKFVLLSKIAKEKKYAQEYLGLLARRGDLGSIRIGKRWYTSREWFSEFLSDAEKRKEEVAKTFLKSDEAKISESIVEVKKEIAPKQEIFTENKNITVAGNKKEYADDYLLSDSPSEIKIRIPEKKQYNAPPSPIPARSMDFLSHRSASPASRLGGPNRGEQAGIFPAKSFSRGADRKSRIKISSPAKQSERVVRRFDDMAVYSEKKLRERWEENKNKKEIPAPRVVFESRNSNSFFSPSFMEDKRPTSLFFPRLAFGVAAVLLFFLLFQAAVSHKEDLMKMAGFGRNQGTVAGASDEKENGIADVRLKTDSYLSNSSNAVKESVSFSKLMINAALERKNSQ
jgi:hypothetical protein